MLTGGGTHKPGMAPVFDAAKTRSDIMERYKVPGLTNDTPQAELTKLLAAIRSVKGVERAQLHLETSEIEIGVKDSHTLKREAFASAASSAGFPFAPDT